MAAKSNNNRGKNKLTHGNKVNTALGQITSGTNLNASLINPKFTPLPKSKFSSLFKTKGTKNPIEGDILFSEPSRTETRYKADTVPREIDPQSLRSARQIPVPRRPTPNVIVTKTFKGPIAYQVDSNDYRTYTDNLNEIQRVEASNKVKASNLATAQRNYQYDMGVRRTHRSKPQNRKGSNPGKTPTRLGPSSEVSRA
tara:strand:- start:42 stop:635 length:594 start_codon:yes stop_codon:yes gene_type:complete